MLSVDVGITVRCSAPGAVLLRVRADPDDGEQQIVSESLDAPGATVTEAQTAEGPLTRLAYTADGEWRVSYRASVVPIRSPESSASEPPPLGRVALERVRWTEPSRYCPADELAPVAATIAGDVPRRRVIDAIGSWIEDNLVYRPEATAPLLDASDTFLARAGVCRDFAHLTVALLRALGVPARTVACYSSGVEPPDFHAVAEAHDGERWRLIDTTGMTRSDSIVRIATGLDAAQVPWATTDGGAEVDPAEVAVV